jgi:hypothetical protein
MFAISFCFSLTFSNLALIVNFKYSNFIALQFRAGRYKISAQQQAVTVGSKQ